MTTNLRPNRWYFFEIYPRDLEEPQWSFVGKYLAGDAKIELVLQDQDGVLYYFHIITDIIFDDDVETAA